MARRLHASLLVLAMAASPAIAQVAAGDSGTNAGPQVGVTYVGTGSDERAANEATRAALAEPMSMTLTTVGLRESLEHFAQLTNTQIDVNWTALNFVGINRNSNVSISLNSVSGEVILNHILKEVSAECFEDDKAGYCVDHGIVTISTLADTKTYTQARIYDIRALLREPYRPVGMVYSEAAFTDAVAFRSWVRGQRVYPFSDAMLAALYRQQIEAMREELSDLAQAPEDAGDGPIAEWADAGLIRAVADEVERARNNRGVGGGGGGGLFAADEDDVDQTYARSTIEAIEELVVLIQDSVGDPDEWLDEESMIRDMGGELVIETTQANHRAIEMLLNALLDAEVEDQASAMRDAQVMVLLHEATKLQIAGEFAEALPLIERALQIDPNHITAHAMRRVVAQTLEREGE